MIFSHNKTPSADVSLFLLETGHVFLFLFFKIKLLISK